MIRIRSLVLASMVASLGLATATAALAHSGRGVTLHHSETARPDPGYVPPAPETLGGPFELVDHNGKKVTDETYRGRWMVLFFGFTGCREACPLGLERIGQAMDDLGPLAANIQPLFVDLDFGEPDIEGLAQFISNFDKRIVGLTGSRAQIYDILRDFRIRRQMRHILSGTKETGPRIDHSTYFFMVDPEGKTRSYFHHSISPAEMADHMRKNLTR